MNARTTSNLVRKVIIIMSVRLNKMDIVREVAERTGFRTRDVQTVYEALLDSIREDLLDGYEVQLRRLGKLAVVHGEPRRYTSFTNPSEYLYSTTQRRLRFTVSSTLKKELYDMDLMDKAEKEEGVKNGTESED